MAAGDPLKADATDADIVVDDGESTQKTNESKLHSDGTVEAPVIETEADSATSPDSATADPADGIENFDDDAWLDACRDGAGSAEEEPEKSGLKTETQENTEDSSQRPNETADEADTAVTEQVGRTAGTENTGSAAMSKLGNTAGVIAEPEENGEERSLDSAFDAAAAAAAAATPHDLGVAPYIANAERELEAANSAEPIDVFDRIAQAAEAEYDISRGSTAVRAVNDLVDDRRVGTKRWTPSKTVKKRMEKLEAARRAMEAEKPVTADTTQPADDAQPSEEAVIAETPAATTEAAPELDDRVVISRKSKQQDTVSDDDQIEETAPEAEAEDDDDAGLRIIPGVRGRRRDRARKSRLDEDFEQIFDDGKASIGSLRRKLRGGGKPAEDTDAPEESQNTQDTQPASITETTFGAEAEPQKKQLGLFAKFAEARAKIFKPKPKVAETEPDSETGDTAEDHLIDALETDDTKDTADLVFESTDEEAVDDEAWEQIVQNQRRQRQISMPIIGLGIAIAAGSMGFVLFKSLFG